MDDLNSIAGDPNYRDFFRENFLGFTEVLHDKHMSLPKYITAVKYVSYKLMGMTNEKAWQLSHPERYKECIQQKKDASYIRSVVCAYNKGLMVQRMLNQAMIPVWVLNQVIPRSEHG